MEKLTDYYRGLGYFRARVGSPMLEFNEKENWVTITYVIDEGPRYKVRSVSVIGNKKYSNDELMADLKLKSNDYYNQSKVLADKTKIQDKYGCVGYVFADVQPESRLLEDVDQLDLVYSIKEGDPYRVGKINVQIKGEYPHTLITTVLNRLSFKPGELVDIRELRASERRLKASQLFEANPASGKAPKIEFKPPGQENADADDADKPDGADKSKSGRKRGGFRSQSPDPPPRERFAELTVDCGQYIGPADLKAEPPAYQATPAYGANGRTEGPEAKAEGNDQLTQMTREFSAALAANKTPPPQSPARLIPTQLYQPASGQLNSAPQSAGPQFVQRRGRRTGREQSAAGHELSAASGCGTAGLRAATLCRSAGRAAATVPPGYAPPYAAQPGGAHPSGSGPTCAALWPECGHGKAPTGRWKRRRGQPCPVRSSARVRPSAADRPAAALAEPLPFTATTEETMTGRLQLGVGVNSDAGLVGSLTLDEQNFDWTRLPTSWEDIRNGTAFRGAGATLPHSGDAGHRHRGRHATRPAVQRYVPGPLHVRYPGELGVERVLLRPHLYRIYRPAAGRPHFLRIPAHPRLFGHGGLPGPEHSDQQSDRSDAGRLSGNP